MFLRRATTVLSLGAVLALTGCGDDSAPGDWTTDATGPTSAPAASGPADTSDATDEENSVTDDAPGRTARGEVGRIRVEVPEGWEEWRAEDQLFSLRYSDGEGEDAPTLSLAGHFGPYDTARVGLSTLIADVQTGTPGFSVRETTDIEVPGATSAVRLDFVYGTKEEGGVFEGVWIVASDAQTQESVALALSAHDLDDDLVEGVQSSMTMLEP